MITSEIKADEMAQIRRTATTDKRSAYFMTAIFARLITAYDDAGSPIKPYKVKGQQWLKTYRRLSGNPDKVAMLHGSIEQQKNNTHRGVKQKYARPGGAKRDIGALETTEAPQPTNEDKAATMNKKELDALFGTAK